MAYSAPPQWSHLDYPTAAKMNLYKAGLDAILALRGSDVVNVAITRRIAPVQGYYLINRYRWLIYACVGTGTMEDPAGVGEDVSLSAIPTWAAVDLLTVDWIYPGKLYQVQGVVCCFEDYEDI
jgi:hypothetical protein